MYASQPPRKLHILLVDSDQYTHQKVLQALGNSFVLHYARTLEEATRCLVEFIPDLLVSEVGLLDASGLDLCRLVRSSPLLAHLPVMLLTGNATLQDKIAGFGAGADDYLVKPFDARHLTARIRLLVRIKRLQIDHD